MSYVFANPEWVSAAATDLAGIGSTINEASAAAAAPTGGVLPAGADEVSAVIATLFGAHAQAYQALSQQAAAFHQQFVQLMNTGAGQYASAEALNATPMQEAAAAISAPMQALIGGSPAGSASAAPAAGGNSDEHVLLAGKGGSYVQIGAGASAGAAVSGASGAGAPSGVSPGPAATPGLVTGGGASGVLLGNTAAITAVGAAANGSGTNGAASGSSGSAFGEGGPGVGGVLSGQTPTSAIPTVDREAVSAPTNRGGDEGHAEGVPSNGEHGDAAHSAAPAFDLADEGAPTGEGGLRGDGGRLYGSTDGGFYGAHAGSDGSAQPIEYRTPGPST